MVKNVKAARPNPRSWDDVLACPCDSCVSLSAIYKSCIEASASLYVHDCRMFNHGFQAVEIDRVFLGPAAVGPDFPTVIDAVGFVLDRQSHCDAFVSSWPRREEGRKDFTWTVEHFETGSGAAAGSK